ncbi:hypothetical protein DIPPA_18811 [Diplonema papillatum]|nr:hypothetical protein DIPPA_18811 [Diplonema papillatum]
MMNPEYGTGMVPREVPRLSVVLSSWVQKEVSAGGQENVRKRGGGDAIRDEAGLKAPCYAPLFVRYKTLSTPPLVH